MPSKLIQPVKGTRDFYPEDFAFQKWFYQWIQSVCRQYGFEEYEGPILEPLELYVAKSGDELVKRQAFTLVDRGGETLVLRPEMTPTLARMVAQKENELNFPVKWFTYGRRYRYEKPQRGRGREFFQWDCDILGLDSVEADAEVITIAATMYSRAGLNPKEAVIKVNDRQYIQSALSEIGIDDTKYLSVIKIIDKADKVTPGDFIAMFKDIGLNTNQIDKIQTLLQDKEGYKKSEWLLSLFDRIKTNGVADFVVFDPTIVRGLDYYTKTVFEGWDLKGEFRAIWGGGRYDNLTANVGTKTKIPGVGFAMGDMTLAEVLKANEKYPTLTPCPTFVLVTVFSQDYYKQSYKLTDTLRKNGINAETYLDSTTKLDKQIKYADKKGIPFVAIIGPDEAEKGLVTLKNLQTREQKTIKQEELIKFLISI